MGCPYRIQYAVSISILTHLGMRVLPKYLDEEYFQKAGMGGEEAGHDKVFHEAEEEWVPINHKTPGSPYSV